MLGRRQIREKVIETLYSYNQNPVKVGILENQMFSAIDKIYDLYVYELNFLIALKDVAEQQIEIGKHKFIKTDKDLHPNQKFINNQILKQLEENDERIAHSDKHKELRWELHDDLLVRTFQKMVAGKRYQDFMKEEKTFSFEEDQKFIGKLFLRYVAENEDFHSMYEDRELSWADDFHIANSMVQKTIGFMKEGEHPHTLIKVLKDDDDEDFGSKLLRESINHWESAEAKIKERLQNWEMERIALMDKIVLLAAITEMDFFPQTASRIIINEYVDISKVFGTTKSPTFINGVLDRYVKDTNRIN